jgi:tetratricopeptide (TPR) repeat protein
MAVQGNSGNPYYLHICGLSLAALKQYSEAEQKLLLAIDLKPDEAAFYYDLGFIRVQQKKHADAVEPLQTAVDLQGDNLMARFLLGRSLVVAHKAALIGDFSQRALEQFMAVAEMDPEFPSVHYHIARIHVNEGRTDEARKEYEEELKYHPDNALALLDLGELVLNEGSASEALVYLKRSSELAPEVPNLHYVMSKAFDELGEQERAISSAIEAVRLNPNYIEAHYQLALLYRKSGQLELAREELSLFRKLKDSGQSPAEDR